MIRKILADTYKWLSGMDNIKKFDPKKLTPTDKNLFVGRGYLIFYEYAKNPDIKKVEVGDTLEIDGKYYTVTGKAFGRSVENGEAIFVRDYKTA